MFCLVILYSSFGFCGRKGLDLFLIWFFVLGKFLVFVSNCGIFGFSLVVLVFVIYDDLFGWVLFIKCIENWLEVFVWGLNVFYFVVGVFVVWGVCVG